MCRLEQSVAIFIFILFFNNLDHFSLTDNNTAQKTVETQQIIFYGCGDDRKESIQLDGGWNLKPARTFGGITVTLKYTSAHNVIPR